MHETLENIKPKMSNRIKALSKVRVNEEEIDQLLSKLFRHINYINSISEYDFQLYDRPLDEVFIINEFKDFIRPKSVKIDSANQDCVELLTIITVNEVFDYAEFIDLMAEFRGWFKSDLSQNTSKIADLRKCVSWSEIRHLCSYIRNYEDGTFEIVTRRSSDAPFYPIRLNCDIHKYFRNRYFNTWESEMIEDYLDYWLI